MARNPATTTIYPGIPLARLKAVLSNHGVDVTTPWYSDPNPLVLTYQFEARQPPDLLPVFGVTMSGWKPFSSAEKSLVRGVLKKYEEVANVRFRELTGAADPDISLGRANMPYEGRGQSRMTNGWNGFAVFDVDVNLSGDYGTWLALHEIGHAMGLRHPGAYNVAGRPADPPYLPKSEDSGKYSVMSYYRNTDGKGWDVDLMLYDVAALQVRFGPNLKTGLGNDTYKALPSGKVDLIWDAGGTDRISASGLTKSATIDLTQGKFSSLALKDDVVIAYGTIIENAVGGSGNDRLIGNVWKNTLKGGVGQDAFVFNTKAQGRATMDRISDFSPIDDTIILENAVFNSLGKAGAVKKGFFKIGAEAKDGNDYIIYDKKTGVLSYDEDGSGAAPAVEITSLGRNLKLTHKDFLVI